MLNEKIWSDMDHQIRLDVVAGAISREALCEMAGFAIALADEIIPAMSETWCQTATRVESENPELAEILRAIDSQAYFLDGSKFDVVK